jgi:pyruvate kinase
MRVIAVFTESGFSARLVSKYRPRCPIVGFSPSQETRRCMSLFWGVRPFTIKNVSDVDQLAEATEKRLLEEKLVKRGDVIGIISGTPFGATGTTNMMRLHRIGG